MSEPRIFTAKGKSGEYNLLMAENGAPPEVLAEFVNPKVASQYTELFQWLYTIGEKLTNMYGGSKLTEEEIVRIGYDALGWCDDMAGG